MSEQRPPNRPRDGHPEEALAAFTDGAATPDEHALVLAHLQGCAECRRDVETARRALDALATLPEPQSPTLDPSSIVREAGNVVGIDTGGSRRRGVARLGSGVVVGGLASGLVAAGIVFVLATGGLKLGGGGASTAASGSGGAGNFGPVSPTESGHLAMTKSAFDYTPQTIDQLARGQAALDASGGQPGGTPRTSPIPSPVHRSAALLADAQSCTNPQIAGAERLLSVMLARFEGKPAFVAVLRTGSAGVRVVVTDRTTCSVLYVSSAPSASP
jgi:hypothetical protein